MVVSTGVGGGLVLDGRLINGGTGNAGHIGHLVVDPEGPACACGGRGCLEAIASGPSMVGWALSQGWTAERPDGIALAMAARGGDEVAAAAFQRCGTAVGIAIAGAAALLDLDVAVIGGGISHAGDLIMEPVFEAFTRHAGLRFAQRCRIVLAAADSGLVGAAAMFIASESYWGGSDSP
jgi:glucokinase